MCSCLSTRAFFYSPYARGKNDTPKSRVPFRFHCYGYCYSFADPSARDEVLFYFILLRAALSAFARVIGNISSKERKRFSAPLLLFLALFSFRVTNKVMQFSSRRIISYRMGKSSTQDAYDLSMKNVLIIYDMLMVNFVKILIVSIRINYIVFSSDNIDAILRNVQRFCTPKLIRPRSNVRI